MLRKNMQTFLEFFQRDEDDARKKLKLLKSIFDEDGMYSMDFTSEEEREPYIFVTAPSDLSFQGIRFYQKGDITAFMIQKEPKVFPYGKAYFLDLQKMLDDIMVDESDKDEALKELKKQVTKKIKMFFKQTKKAEDKIVDAEISGNGLPGYAQITIRNVNNEPTNPNADKRNPALMRTGGTDYSNTFYNSNTSN
jgi:hypothetical protein